MPLSEWKPLFGFSKGELNLTGHAHVFLIKYINVCKTARPASWPNKQGRDYFLLVGNKLRDLMGGRCRVGSRSGRS